MYSANRSFAFGADVPTPHGTFVATSSPPYCGSPFAMQQMLADLGFYTGPISGTIDGPTLKAAADFGRSRGISTLSHVTPEFCRMLTSDWERLQAGVPSPNLAASRAPSSLLRPPSLLTPSYLRLPGASSDPLLDEPPEYQPPAPLAKAGWAGLDETTKYAIAGGAALAVAGLVVLVVVGKKRKKR